ncbi:tRNA epoxyqueuosine(34) reductase QueG [Vannielia litorea]|uniref:Epoxyqueuosine reductase n=1 Tax=Vannielia litorea TaxID=1217970 RepID=A0A1N6HGH0_9RHOB|nr:tRNA epoxyqueuosine(34) reductase QueG [Vannielia litorea]SIO18870.1 epoxyqueuosine reductase [Vannielia litorea]
MFAARKWGRRVKDAVVARALEEGFSLCRVARAGPLPGVPEGLRAFLAEGRHGEMDWMEKRLEWREDPSALWPEARSVIVLGESYGPEYDPLAGLEARERGLISAYARGRDYHDIVKKRLKRLGRWLIEEFGGEIKVFVDTAPVAEKPLAQAAGLGWQGKHTNLVSREMGSWFFIGSIFTTLDIEPDPAESDHCGGCRRCLDVCPTEAFPAPYQLDARRCISYLTIEHAGPVPEDLRSKLGNRIYGCDDCLAVCPWNKFAVAAADMRYRGGTETDLPALEELAGLDDAAFRARFSGSPIKRIGRARFVRNVLYAIGNSGAGRLRAVAQELCEDEDPVVADAARWAMARLG